MRSRGWLVVAACCGAVAVVAVVKVVGDLVVELRRERRREVDGLLAVVSRTVNEIIAPVDHGEAATALMVGNVRTRTAAGLPYEGTGSISPHARPSWGDPQVGDEPVEWDDPIDLSQPLDTFDPKLMQAGRLSATYGPVPLAEPVPEDENGNGRVTTFAPGENPLSDIGETPAWEE